MRIVIVPSWYDSPRFTNRGSFIRTQARGLAQRGHSVTVIAPDRDASYPLLKTRSSVEDGMTHYRIAVPKPWHRILGFYLPSSISSVIRKLISQIDPHVVHAHVVRPGGILTQLAIGQSNIPWCLTEHSNILTYWWTSHGRGQIACCYHASPRLFAVSESLRQIMIGLFPKQANHTEILYNGIDTDLFTPLAESPGGNRLLFVGGLIEIKGVSCLFRAIKELDRKVILTVVGIGPLKDSLLKEADQLGIRNQIIWHGQAKNSDMPKLFAAHDLVVVPSLRETFSIVCAEALACGRPVVATRCGGPEEVVPNEGGILVPPGDYKALARGINEILTGNFPFSPLLAVQYVRDNFSLSHLVDRLEEIYDEMLH